MTQNIAYPDVILNDDLLNQQYETVSYTTDEHFICYLIGYQPFNLYTAVYT